MKYEEEKTEKAELRKVKLQVKNSLINLLCNSTQSKIKQLCLLFPNKLRDGIK